MYAGPALAVEIPGMQGLGETRYHEVTAAELAQTYHVFVRLPSGYNESGERRYPTAYILDGGELYPMLSSYYQYLRSGQEVPDVILVAIGYGTDDYRSGNNRSRDYTAPSTERDFWGGAEQFRTFLSEQLIPFIEQEYRTRKDRRIVFGQSLGGQFVLYTAQTDPDLFWGHIASNPALHRNLPFFLEPHWDDEQGATRSRLFVASGENDDPRFRQPALQWIDRWTSVDETPWDLKTVSLPGHSHFSAPPASFRQGMIWLFSDH